jgi:hypothetical protein
MKRFLTIAASLLIVSTLCFAQEKQEKNDNRKAQFEEMMKKIQSEKVGFFTAELDLTPEEAQVFWPVYNQYTKESREAHEATVTALRAMKNKKNEQLSDSEMENRIKTYLKAMEKEQNLMNTYFEKFKKVLPINKVAKLYLVEDSFRMKMINNLRKPGPGHQVFPQGQKGPQGKGAPMGHGGPVPQGDRSEEI